MRKGGAGARVRYDRLVPSDTFIHDYMRYMDAQETPYAYDFWTACWALSVAVGRGTVVARPRAEVYLNLYAILVAESGTTRKSTAVNAGVKFGRALEGPLPHFIQSKTTPEKIEGILHDQTRQLGRSSIAIAIPELVTFLGREKYTETMPTLLTDLYDCPSLRDGGGTLSKGDRGYKDAYVSLLSASTPAWLLRAVNPDVIEGGFTSRVLFIVSETPKRLSAWPKEQDDELRIRATQRLSEIRTRAQSIPSIAISDGGLKSFDRWYKSRHVARDPFRASFHSREDAHILRLSALLCINDGLWVIQHTHIMASIRIITQVREDGASIFEGTGANSQLVLGIDKLRDKLLAGGLGGVTQKDLTAYVQRFMNAQHMKAVLDIMQELEMVQQFSGVQVGRGRPTTIWRATNELAKTKALDTIIRQHQPGGA